MDVRPASATLLTQWLVERVAQAARVDVDSVDLTQPFATFGIDSQEAVEISGELAQSLGLHLPATLLWDYPTIAEVVEYLRPKLFS